MQVLTALCHPFLFTSTASVEGLIAVDTRVALYHAVKNTRSESQNVVEVGAYKGLSTVFLAKAAKKVGKRVKTFELFTGLPCAEPNLDSKFHVGQYASDIEEFEFNLHRCGVSDTVDLTVGDARQTMLPAISKGGFAVAFLDVDVYEVTHNLLCQLWSLIKGDEVIFVHDINSPGVRRAVNEFHALSGRVFAERVFSQGYTAELKIPNTLPHWRKSAFSYPRFRRD